jgi:hypothetical protein
MRIHSSWVTPSFLGSSRQVHTSSLAGCCFATSHAKMAAQLRIRFGIPATKMTKIFTGCSILSFLSRLQARACYVLRPCSGEVPPIPPAMLLLPTGTLADSIHLSPNQVCPPSRRVFILPGVAILSPGMLAHGCHCGFFAFATLSGSFQGKGLMMMMMVRWAIECR